LKLDQIKENYKIKKELEQTVEKENTQATEAKTRIAQLKAKRKELEVMK